MHNYINLGLLRDFRAKKSIDIIIDDLKNKYKIYNILQDDIFEEYVYRIAEALFLDYKNGLSNYEAYIEEGMNVRMLMELRKSAIIPLSTSLSNFYTGHSICNTVDDVKRFRTKFLKKFNQDYQDLNWQYYFLIRHTLGYKSIGFIFDFEECYEDGDYRLQTNPENYENDFIKAHLQRV